MNDIITTICLLAGVQGILLTIVLATRRQNHVANKILAVATFVLSIDMLSAVYYTKGIFREYPHLMGISYPFPLIYGPIFYLYVKILSKKAEKFRKRDLLHFLPVVIIYLLCIPEFLYTAGQKIVFVENIMQSIHSPKFTVFENIMPFQGMLYTLFTVRLVGEYDKKIRDEYSNIDRINLNWLKYIAFAGLIIWVLVALVFYVSAMKNFEILIQISLSIMIYSIGYIGLKQPEIFINQSEEIIASESVQSEKYKRSGLSEKLAGEIAERLKDYMESEKPYLDNDLTMQKLAEVINVSNHNLSEVINSQFNISYYDFINNYRVEEFKKRIADPVNDKYNILSIAFDSGFKSKGSFNSIFKKSTGLTPSEYKTRFRKKEQ